MAILLAAAAIPTVAQDIDERAVIRVASEVQKRILSLPEYGVFDSLNFGIKGTTIILKGYASRPILKDSAERVVKGIEGVTAVDNKIQVLPLSPMDDQIRAALYARIYRHPTLQRYGQAVGGANRFFSVARAAGGITNDPPIGFHAIHLVVQNGNVTLAGVVNNSGDKALAGILANQVPNVFAVENDILVDNDDARKAAKPPKK
jgi:hypothetical protein